jgi:hypothetical protein
MAMARRPLLPFQVRELEPPLTCDRHEAAAFIGAQKGVYRLAGTCTAHEVHPHAIARDASVVCLHDIDDTVTVGVLARLTQNQPASVWSDALQRVWARRPNRALGRHDDLGSLGLNPGGRVAERMGGAGLQANDETSAHAATLHAERTAKF